jgi:hypothetical protein
MTEYAPDIRLLLFIHENEKKNNPVWHTMMVKESGLTAIQISMEEDRLMDLCLIDGKYEKVGDRWTYCYHLEEEAKDLVGRLLQRKDGDKLE